MFPSTPLQARIDLGVGGAWTDITADTLSRDGASSISITRGRRDEASRADPSICDLTLKNTAGKYSPRNPTSPYYGLIGRNTPLRVGIGVPPIGAGVNGLTGVSLVAPSVTAEASGQMFCAWLASPVGNVTMPGGFFATVELDGALSTFRGGAKAISAGATGASTATYSLAATAGAALTIAVPGAAWSTVISDKQTAGNTFALAVTGLVAGEYALAFYGWSSDPDDRMPAIADEDGGCEWLLIDDTGPSAGPRLRAYIRRVTATATMNVTFYGTGASGGDVYGQVWRMTATDYYPRFVGEVSSWPPKWDLSGHDVWVPIQASGIKRRLAGGAGGATPLRSALFRQFTTLPNVAAYWSLEDGASATGFASGLPGGSAMGFVGTPAVAAYSDFSCSTSVPTFTAAGAVGSVPDYATTNEFTVGALIHIPPTGMVDETTLISFTTTGSVRSWSIKFDTAGPGFRVEAFNSLGASVLNQSIGPWTTSVLDSKFFLYLQAAPSGSDIAWLLRYIPIVAGSNFPVSQNFSATIAGQTIGAVRNVGVGWAADLAGEPAIGHVVVAKTSTALFLGGVWRALVAWNGEDADIRVLRLCEEEGIPLYRQSPSVSSTMGPQLSSTMLDLLGECETADDGLVFEPKGFLGLAYRTRTSKYNQVAGATLSYTAGNVSAPLEPVDDDQGVVNDVTATRAGGSSSRSELTTGALSTQAPPDGIGRYSSEITLNVDSDLQLPDQASWRMHVGTWDDARWPSVHVDLAKNPALIGDITALDVGDLVSLTNLPAWVPPGPVDLILEGYTETLGHPSDWDIVGNFSPAGPYRVGVWDSTGSRYSSDGSTVYAGVTSTATAIQAYTPTGPLWIDSAAYPAQFPFDISVAGEQMTVTAATAFGPVQTFTVTRSVNGIVKAQVAGAVVELYRPAVYAL